MEACGGHLFAGVSVRGRRATIRAALVHDGDQPSRAGRQATSTGERTDRRLLLSNRVSVGELCKAVLTGPYPDIEFDYRVNGERASFGNDCDAWAADLSAARQRGGTRDFWIAFNLAQESMEHVHSPA